MTQGKIKLTNQELFDNAARGVLKQGKPAGVYDPNCRFKCYYRVPGEPDCRCNLGWSIPDDRYRPDMEDKTGTGICIFPVVQDDFIDILQAAHDNAAREAVNEDISIDNARFIKRYKTEMASIASAYGLSTAALER